MRVLCTRAFQLAWLTWASLFLNLSSFAHGLGAEQALECNMTDPRLTRGSADVKSFRIGYQSHNSGDPCRKISTDLSYSSMTFEEANQNVSKSLIVSKDTLTETRANPATCLMLSDIFVFHRAYRTSASPWLRQPEQEFMPSRKSNKYVLTSNSRTS